MTLVHSALLTLKPSVSGCKWDFVHWPLKSVPVYLATAISLLDEILTDFHSQILCGCLLLALVLLAVGPSVELRPPFFLRGNLCCWDIPWNLSHHPWGWDQPFSTFRPSYQSWCGLCESLVITLLFSWSSVGYSGWFLYILVVVPVWSWEEASVTLTTLLPSRIHCKCFRYFRIKFTIPTTLKLWVITVSTSDSSFHLKENKKTLCS